MSSVRGSGLHSTVQAPATEYRGRGVLSSKMICVRTWGHPMDSVILSAPGRTRGSPAGHSVNSRFNFVRCTGTPFRVVVIPRGAGLAQPFFRLPDEQRRARNHESRHRSKVSQFNGAPCPFVPSHSGRRIGNHHHDGTDERGSCHDAAGTGQEPMCTSVCPISCLT